MNHTDVPIWEKYTLTIEEAAKYFRIGENKLRKLAEENPNANWVMRGPGGVPGPARGDGRAHGRVHRRTRRHLPVHRGGGPGL